MFFLCAHLCVLKYAKRLGPIVSSSLNCFYDVSITYSIDSYTSHSFRFHQFRSLTKMMMKVKSFHHIIPEIYVYGSKIVSHLTTWNCSYYKSQVCTARNANNNNNITGVIQFPFREKTDYALQCMCLFVRARGHCLWWFISWAKVVMR